MIVVRRRVQIKIVGHKALAAPSHFLLLDHRMASFDNLNLARIRALYKAGPAIIAQSRDVRQRGQHIHFRQRQSGLPDALGLPAIADSQFGKQPPFDLDNLFLRVENLGLVFLQLRSGKALRIHQGLLAFVICGTRCRFGFETSR